MSHRIAIALLLALVTASGLAAQSTPADTNEGKQIVGTLQVTGTVLSSEANRLMVRADNGQEMTFIVTDKSVDPKVFRPGDRVTASYVTLAGTGPVVTKVVSYDVATKPTSTGTVIYPKAEPAPVTPAPAPVPAPTPEPVAAPPAEPAPVLPATASPLALIALAGFGAGAAARITRRLRNRK